MNIVLLGPPGAGKGTFAQKAASHYHVPHIAVGDLFRNAVKQQTPLGRKVKTILENGALVPDKLTTIIVRERIRKEDTKEGFLLDGYPRTVGQADALVSFSHIDWVLHFHVDEEEIIARLSGRRICQDCGANYHVTNIPPRREDLCDTCNGLLYTRDDDKPEAISKRIRVYNTLTMPLVKHFKEKGILIFIDAGRKPFKVFEEILEKVPQEER